MKLSNLVKDGQVNKHSDGIIAGAYNAFLQVQKSCPSNGNCCGMYLELREGPFPCRVSNTFEVVHWDGKDESACKKEMIHIYDKEVVCGFADFIPLSKLTAAASPYVKDGHVTFVTNFRIHPSA